MLGVTIRFDTYHNADDNLVSFISSRHARATTANAWRCAAEGVHRRSRPLAFS